MSWDSFSCAHVPLQIVPFPWKLSKIIADEAQELFAALDVKYEASISRKDQTEQQMWSQEDTLI